MRRAPVVVAALLIAGCRNLEDPAPSQATRLVIHGVLDMQRDDQTVLVYRARTGLPSAVEGSAVSDDQPVGNAQVSMTNPDGFTVPADRLLTSSGDCCVPGIYQFATGPFVGMALHPGGTYTLRILTPAGEVVTGTTTIPGPAEFILDPRRIFFRQRDTLRLSWSRIPGASSYEVIIRMAFGEYRTFADTSFEMAGTALTIAGDEIFSSGEDTDVVVSAVDANYYDYYRSQSDPFAGAAPSHLSGAVGVFGSIVPIYHVPLRVR
jgi:hypothetical protein